MFAMSYVLKIVILFIKKTAEKGKDKSQNTPFFSMVCG